MPALQKQYLALSGGVGGAKLALGLSRLLGAGELICMVNTADDFQHLGLHVSPDLDTLMYTLAGCSDPERGWGYRDETWHFMEALARIGGPQWFRLGDRDLATHVLRTHALRGGATLTEVTQRLCRGLRVEHAVLPMCDEPVATWVGTPDGELPFQEYFVKQRCGPKVIGFRFDGIERARVNKDVVDGFTSQRIAGVIICPSNPFISIDPILSIPGFRQMLAESDIPIVAVSPIVGVRAFKGPTARMMVELGMNPSAAGIARHYAEILSGFVADRADASALSEITALGIRARAASIAMLNCEDKIALARDTLGFLRELH